MFSELLKNVMNLGIITEDDVKRLTSIELMLLIIERINGLLTELKSYEQSNDGRVSELEKKFQQILELINKELEEIAIEHLNELVADGTIEALINQTTLKHINDRIDETNAQLSTKLNQNSVLSMANMGQDVKEAMTAGSVAVVGKNSVLNENIVDGQVTYSKLASEITQFERIGMWYVEYMGDQAVGCPAFSTNRLKDLNSGDTVNVKFTIDNLSKNISNIYFFIVHTDSLDSNLNQEIDGQNGAELNFTNGLFELDYTLTKSPKEYLQLLVVANSKDGNLVRFIISDIKLNNNVVLNKLNYFYLSNPSTLSKKVEVKKLKTDLITKEYLDVALGGYTPTKYKGKIVGTFGDSLTDGYTYTNNTRYDNNEGKYQQTMIDLLGCDTINFGSSGGDILRLWEIVQGKYESQGYEQSSEWYKPTPNFQEMDAVTIMIGTNEITNGQQGTINDLNGDDYHLYPATYYGTYGKCIEYMLEHNPKLRIYLMTPPWCDRGYIGDVAVRTREIAQHYHLPIIDCYAESGLNKYNQPTYMPDKLHQNPDGTKLLGTYIANQMLSK